MKIYVAAKWEEQTQARQWMDLLQRAGHTITYDWTRGDTTMTCEQAIKDAHGVMAADALVLVCERKLAYAGALVEMGIAIDRGIPIYLTGHAIDTCIFTKLPLIRYDVETLLRTVV